MEELLVEQKECKLFPSQLKDAEPSEILLTPPENLLQASHLLSSYLSANTTKTLKVTFSFLKGKTNKFKIAPPIIQYIKLQQTFKTQAFTCQTESKTT